MERPLRSARMLFVRVMRGEMRDSACAGEEPMIVIWPILRPGLEVLPYMCRAAVGIAMAFCMISLWECSECPPRMLSIIAEGNMEGMVELWKVGMMPRMERS